MTFYLILTTFHGDFFSSIFFSIGGNGLPYVLHFCLLKKKLKYEPFLKIKFGEYLKKLCSKGPIKAPFSKTGIF